MKKFSTILLLLLSIIVNSQSYQIVNSEVKEANIYNNNAELKHTAKVNLVKGYQEIIIKNISFNIKEESIVVSNNANANILSISYQSGLSDYEKEIENKSRTKIKNDSIKLIETKIKLLYNDKNITENSLTILSKNEDLFRNNNSSVLELNKLVDYNKTKRTEIYTSLNKINEEITLNSEKLNKLKNYIPIQEAGRIVLAIDSQNATHAIFNISYLEVESSWKPFYTININKINEPILLNYKAKINQNSELNWNNVKLKLTSGNANMRTEAPEINKTFLYYYNPEEYEERRKEKQIEEVVVTGYSSRQNQLNISFDVDKPYNLPSKDEPQLVDLQNIKIPATYKYISIPKFDRDTYLVAEIENYSNYNLLPGEANIIFEGTYVGETEVKPQQTTDKLNISLGKDKNIAVKRELITDKSGEKTFSSYKEQNYMYEITIRNNKKEKVEIELKDQVPISTDKDMTIEFIEKNGAELNAETGILTWNIKLNSNETKKIRFSFKVKYPKDKQIQKIN